MKVLSSVMSENLACPPSDIKEQFIKTGHEMLFGKLYNLKVMPICG
ncbi:MAG: hypothetical protein GXO88_10150 [Chlorobi bacterium]|nr:hypothetical protein [Chlorobiota bacterium]